MMRPFFLAALLAAGTASAASMAPVLSCRMSDGSQSMLQAETTVDGKRLFLTVDGKTDKAFTDMPDTDFVGEVKLRKCVDGVLVFALNYGSPYTKGVALRKNPATHAVERIDFAEKALPRWLYTSATGMSLVVPNEGYETSGKYLVYEFVSGKGQAEAARGVERLPGRQGWRVARLR